MTTKLAALAVLLMLLSALAAACGSGTTLSSGATNAASRTTQPATTMPADRSGSTPMTLRDSPLECPVEQAICDAAISFQDTLNAGGDAVAQLAKPVQVTCPSEGVSAGLDPLCADTNVGATVTVFSVGVKKLTFVDRDGLAQAINLMTEPVVSKGWGFHVASVGCPKAGNATDCAAFYAAAYVGALGSPGSHTQQVVIIASERDGATARPMAFLNQQYDPDFKTGGWCDAINGDSCAFNFGGAPVESSAMPGEILMLPWAPDKLS